MATLTDVQIRHWMRAAQPLAKADGGGLTFTVSARGTAAWVLRYRHGGKARELTIGRYPDIGLAKARELATDERARIQQGVDVAREKQQAKHAVAAAQVSILPSKWPRFHLTSPRDNSRNQEHCL